MWTPNGLRESPLRRAEVVRDVIVSRAGQTPLCVDVVAVAEHTSVPVFTRGGWAFVKLTTKCCSDCDKLACRYNRRQEAH
jgi:hypothetical protein